jgi:BirA family transcriptional regulator, biotin operon repressor / biotin---[acetyl-CoA-carboxylase] ligase
MRLHPAAAAAGFGLAVHRTLPSTNAEALALAPERGKANPLWVTADQQTAGRGRRGNEWISPPGNLYATLLLSDPSAPARAPELSFVAALAAHDAILTCAPGLCEKLALKWPNDVLCGGLKLAGILIESRSLEDGLTVAIGLGVNCKHHPPLTTYPATDLAAAGADVAAGDLFFALSGAMLGRLEQWRRGESFAAIRADWLDRATDLGGEVKVRLPDRELLGRWEALDAAGRLLLRRPDGILEPIAAGDVFPVGAVAIASATAAQERVG